MFTKLRLLIVLIISSLLLSGCGDLLGKKVVKKKLDGSFAELRCKLKIDKFSEILYENIEPEINCLGDSLNLFIKLMTSGKPGSISRLQLESYLRDFEPDVTPEVIKALGSIFQLGHLLTGDDPNYVSQQTVDKVITFVRIFNREAARYYSPIFENDNAVSYTLHNSQRNRIGQATIAISNALEDVYKPDRGGQIHKLNIHELIEAFRTKNNSEDMDKFKKFLFVKTLIVGGRPDEITHLEFNTLISNLKHLIPIGLDLLRYEKISFEKNQEIVEFLDTSVKAANTIFRYEHLNNRDNMVLFTFEEAMEAAKIILKDKKINGKKIDLEKYRNLILEAKKLFMTGNSTEIKGIELKNLFDHAMNVLRTGGFFYRLYKSLEVQLNRRTPVAIDFNEYRIIHPKFIKEVNQFERIVKRYRFMKGEFLSAYYNEEYWRNPDAIFEIGALEYVLQVILGTYGSLAPGTVGGYTIDAKQMEFVMQKFEKELIELDLILPQRAITTANNISLLGSLFQFQSDNNGLMDINEGTEFATTVFSALNVAEDVKKYLVEEKGCKPDDFGRIYPECFRENFWEALCSNYRDPDLTDNRKNNDYLPLLFKSLNAPNLCKDWKNTSLSAEFLDRAIRAGRACMNYNDGQREEIPYTEGDIMTLMVVLFHTETTILRWDTNKNNYMDADEVNRAYEIYSPALDGFLKDKSPIIKRFKKQIYQYMIKYERVPDEKDYGSILKFIRFLLSFDKSAPAYRKTIASLLMAIGEQNSKMQTGPVYDCSRLRDPDKEKLRTSRGGGGDVSTLKMHVPYEDNGPDYSHYLEPYLDYATAN